MSALALWLIAFAVALLAYAYALYPALLKLLGFVPRRAHAGAPGAGWPLVSIVLPVYNGAGHVRRTIESLLQVEYPSDRLQVLVLSDGSTDGTDDIVREYAARGVELLRMPVRRGKTAAENAARPHLRGEIIVNTDATVRVRPDAVKALVRSFADPSVGVASGRDVSVSRLEEFATQGESAYVGYEMWVRRLETAVRGIVGASGCLYAIRARLNDYELPGALSRDFASALVAREHGYRAISVDEAICLVPRTGSLHGEYRRKVRTITRGMQTLFHKRAVLNPFRYGVFAWMLVSHKLTRWALPWALAGALVGVGLLATSSRLAAVAGVIALGGLGLAGLAFLWPEQRAMPRLLSLPAFALAGNLAAMYALLNALHRDGNPIWEPTRREDVMPRPDGGGDAAGRAVAEPAFPVAMPGSQPRRRPA